MPVNYKKIIKSQHVRFAILRMLYWVPDATMLKWQYRLKLGRKLNLRQPERFTEKIQHYKLYYRNDDLLICTDKLKVRDFVKARIGEEYLNTLLGVYDHPADIDFDNLPERFVLKTTDGGGGDNVLICHGKSDLDIPAAVEKLSRWKDKKLYHMTREWAYIGAKKSLIIAEEYLEDDENPDRSIDDYKFLCFHGKPEYVVVDSDRYSGHKRNIYDLRWNNLRIGTECPPLQREKPCPPNFEKMLDIAAKLSQEFPFVRVDLYNIKGRILFGEMTFYPWSGCVQYDPDDFDYELGQKFDIHY